MCRLARYSTITVGWASLVLTVGCAARVPVDPLPRYKDGDSCTTTDMYLSKSCGISTGVELTGQAVYRTATGGSEPVGEVEVYDVSTPRSVAAPQLIVRGDSSGRFRLVRTLSISKTQWCRNGSVVTDDYLGAVQLLLRARGCQDREIEIRPAEGQRAYEMQCDVRRPSG